MGRQFTLLRPLAAALLAMHGLLAAAAQAERSAPPGEVAAQVESLRRDGRFVEAEQLCQRTLADTQLPDDQRANLVIAWSQTLLEHALQTPPVESDVQWQQAHDVARRFGLEHPRHPQLTQVQLQAALVTLARGETLRQHAELTRDNRASAAAARDALRQAVREFTTLLSGIDGQLRQRVRQKPDRPALSDEQLLHLRRQGQLHLARALRNQAQSFGARTPERSDALNQALAQLAPLSSLDDQYPVAWPARVEELTVWRLMEDFPAAAQRLEALAERSPPAAWGPLIRAEAVRLSMARRDLSAAVTTVERPRGDDWPASPELDLVELELYLTLAQGTAAGGNENATAAPAGHAAQWQTRADQVVARIEGSHGSYWSRRAEALLASGVAVVGRDMSQEALAKTADGLARAGRWDEALAAYDAATAKARDDKELDLAFDLAYRAATVLHGQKSYAAAAERFRQLALGAWEHPRAADAHLLAIYNTAQLPTDDSTAARMTALLEEHLRHWPQATSAGEVRWQLGRQQQQADQWQAAIEAYRGVASTHPRSVEAIAAAGDCYRQWLNRLRRDEQATAGVADAAWQYFLGLTLDQRGQPLAQLGPREIAAVQAAAELRLAFDPRAATTVAALLRRAMSASDAAASALLPHWVWCQAALGDETELRAALPRVAQTAPNRLVELLAWLDEGRADWSDGPRRAGNIARTEIAQRALARRDELQPTAQRDLDRLYARALADAGQSAQASEYYERLSAAHPRDAAILAEHARFLSQRNDRVSWEAALAKWRLLERGTRAPEVRWFEAKYELALLHLRLGNPDQAAKIVTVTQALHPELGGPEWKTKFLVILERARR